MSVALGLAFAGLLAGLLTTLLGLGGGLLLVLGLSVVWDPRAALACSAAALLSGNLQRWWLFRRSASTATARRFAWGALPGALCAGLLAAYLPATLVRVALGLSTSIAVASSSGWLAWRPGPRWMAPGGFVIGALTGAAGGAGVLVAPLLLTSGLTGEAYVATASACAVVLHVGRVTGYALGGLYDGPLLARAALLACSIFVGNALGAKLRRRWRALPERALETGALVVCVALSLAGFG